jgi:alpha-L-arabinofuranosidase
VNGWSGGIIQASRHDTFVTPTYLVIRLYNETLGRERLAARVVSPTFDSSIEGSGVPVLDAIATRSADGRLYVRAVNTSRSRALTVTVTTTGAGVGARGTIQTVTGNSFEAANSFRTPQAVTVRTRPLRSGGTFTVDLPPHSVSVLTLSRN